MGPAAAITGMGVICGVGPDLREFGQALKSGRQGIDFIEEPVEYLPIRIGAEIGNFSLKKWLGQAGHPPDLTARARQVAGRAPFPLQTSAAAALDAWRQAGLPRSVEDGSRIGIVVAGSNLTQAYRHELESGFRANPEYLTPRYALQYLDTDQVGGLSEIFGIQGEGLTVGGASASGNVAIIKALQSLRAGVVDQCLVVGAPAALSPMELQGFWAIGALGGKTFGDRPREACRPFDALHEGFIPGQAAACLVLESEDSARDRGAKILAKVLGGSMVLAGNRSADPSVEAEFRAMRLALRDAGLEPGQVDYLNSHGTASPLGDETEVRAIRRLFEKSLSRLWINATKGLIGHCLYSAGVVEAIACVIQMREGFVHPNLNLDNPIDDQCRFVGAAAESAEIRVAQSNSFGFGGIHTSLVIGRADH